MRSDGSLKVSTTAAPEGVVAGKVGRQARPGATDKQRQHKRIDTVASVDDPDFTMHVDQPRTIRALIAATAPWLAKRGSSSARLDTDLMIGHALGLKRLDLYLDLDRPLSDDELARCRELVKRRGQGEPIAYILGHREFYGITLAVTPAVLIPRPETERLVELALSMLPDDAEGLFVDVCTGSGCIALAILEHRPGLTALAVDISGAALAVARANAITLGLDDRITFLEGDLLAPCADVRDARLVVSNPPYVVPGSPLLALDVAAFEPKVALYGEEADALGHHRRLVRQAAAILAPDGALLMEIGSDQGAAAMAIQSPLFASASVERDLDGHDRVLVLRR